MSQIRVQTLAFGCMHPRVKLPSNTVNVHLVDLCPGRVLVDAGPPWTGPVLARELQRLGWAPDFVALTHSHIDHAGGVSALLAAFPRARLLANPEEWQTLRRGQVVVPSVIHPWTGIRPVVNWAFTLRPMPSCDPKGSLEELRRLGITPLSTPGHSAAHAALLLPDGQAIAGDIITVSRKGRPQVNCYLEDRATLEESIRLLAGAARSWVHPGHGPRCSAESLRALAQTLAPGRQDRPDALPSHP